MKLEDIESDIERGDIGGMEDAFRVLIGWPREGGIENSTPPTRQDLLLRLCGALAKVEDARTMPRMTFELIMNNSETVAGNTYADGAKAVRRDPAPFFQRLSREA